jgi:Zn-dependent peptidase ImmA (M78 family)
MAGERIPINPEIIVWARKRAGFTLDEAREKFSHIAAWEAGESLPTYPQLEHLANEFKVPVALFFFPQPPILPPIRESFRTLPDAEFERIPRQVQLLLRKGKALQLNLAELSPGHNPAPHLITRDIEILEDIDVSNMAAAVRDYLRITIADQFSWPDDESALKAWRQALTDVGIFVFKDPFRIEGYSGFSLYDDLFPIIYVNNSSTKTRQIFTLFHELSHLLFRTSGIDPTDDSYLPALPERQRHIEILCNRFAAEFLVPEEAFQAAYAEREPSEQTAESLAAQFHVSHEVIYRKFLNRDLIERAEYTRAARRWSEQRQQGGGGNFYWNKISYLGRDYIALALSQYHQNRIDDVRLAEYLDTKPRNIAALEEYFSKGG